METWKTKALDAIIDNFLIYVEHAGSVITQGGIPDHCEEFRGKPGAGDEGHDDGAGLGDHGDPSQGFNWDRGVHADKQYQRRGRFIDAWICKTKTGVCVAAQATLLQP